MPVINKEDFSAFDEALKKAPAAKASDDDFSAFDEALKKKGGGQELKNGGQELKNGGQESKPVGNPPTPLQSPSNLQEGEEKPSWQTSALNPAYSAQQAQIKKEAAPKPKQKDWRDIVLDKSSFNKPVPSDATYVAKNVTGEKIEQVTKSRADMQTAIDNTTERALKAKGLTVPKNSPAYIKQRKKVEDAVKNNDAVYTVDPNTKQPALSQTTGFWESTINAVNRAFNDEDESKEFVNNMTTQQRTDYANKKRAEAYELTKEGYVGKTPSAFLGKAGEMIGGAVPFVTKMTEAGIMATAAVAAAPETFGASLVGLAPTLSFAMTTPSAMYQGGKDEVLRRYNTLKEQNPNASDVDLMSQAESGLTSGEISGTLTNLAFTAIGAKAPAPEVVPVLEKSIANTLKNTAHGTAKSALEMGTISAVGETGKEIEAGIEDKRYKKSVGEIINDAASSFASGVTTGTLLHLTTQAVMGTVKMPGQLKSAIKYGLSKENPAEIQAALSNNEQLGNIPPGTTDAVMTDLNDYNKSLKKTSEDLTPETQASVAGLIQKRDNLMMDMASKDPTQIDPYLQQIDAINEQIKKITESNDPSAHEVNDVTGQKLDGSIADTPLQKGVEGENKAEEITPEQKDINTSQTVVDKINNNEAVNVDDIEKARTALYNLIDARPDVAHLIEPLIQKIESHENLTKTETVKTTEREPIEGTLAAKQKIQIKPALEQSEGSTARVVLADGTTGEGTLRIVDGNYVIEVEGQEPIVVGEKAITDRDLKVPEGESPVELDENGNVKSATFETKDGHKVTITDPEKALDLGIQLSLETVGEIPDEAFDKVYQDVVKETEVEVPVEKPKKAEAEAEPQVPELSEEEYKNFKEKGTVSDERLNHIADKVMNKEELSDREKEIQASKKKDIDKLIEDKEKEKTRKKKVEDFKKKHGKKGGEKQDGEKSGEDILKELEDKGTKSSDEKSLNELAEKNKGNKIKRKIIEQARKAIKTLKSIFPNMDIHLHDNEQDYNDVMGKVKGKKSSGGNFAITKNADGTYSGRIDINLNKAKKTTIAHEVTHAILFKAFGDNQEVFQSFRDKISNILGSATEKGLKEFADSPFYKAQGVTAEEYLSELSGLLSSKTINPLTLSKIASAINAIVSKLTGGKFIPFENVNDAKDVVEFFDKVSSAIKKGNDLTNIGKEKLVETPETQARIKSKSQTEKLFKADKDEIEKILDKAGKNVEGKKWKLSDVATVISKYIDKKKVFDTPIEEVSDKKFVSGIKKETEKELNAWEESVGGKEYVSFYKNDITDRLNPKLQQFAEKRYGRKLTPEEISLYHLVSAFASPEATPEFDSSKGLEVFDKYMKTGNLSGLSDKQATIWALNEKGVKEDTGVPKFTESGEPVMSKWSKGYADYSLNKFKKVIDYFNGDLGKAIDWAQSIHSYEEISNVMGTPLSGTKKLEVHENLSKENGGFGIFGFTGAKLGSYALNRMGEYSTVTKDMWYARTMARLSGESMFDEKGDAVKRPWAFTAEDVRKRKLADKAWEDVAKKKGLSPSDIQERMWDYEKRLWEKLGAVESASYASDGFMKQAKAFEPDIKFTEPVPEQKIKSKSQFEEEKGLPLTDETKKYEQQPKSTENTQGREGIPKSITAGKAGAREERPRNAESYSNPDGTPQYVVKRSDRDGGKRLDISVNGTPSKAKAVYTQSEQLKSAVNNYRNAYTDKNLIELDDPKLFHKLITQSKSINEFGASVHVYEPGEYAQMRLFITPDGKAGVALKPDGDLVSGFSNQEVDKPRRIAQLLGLAIKEGAMKADSFDTVLPQYYLDFGLIPVAQDKWNEQFKPEKWDKEVFKRWNNGEPDVIYYVYKGGDRSTISERAGEFGNWKDLKKDVPYAEYDDAIEIQEQKVKENDTENITGLPSKVGIGEEPIPAESKQGAGTEKTGAGGVLQAQGTEGEGGGVGEKVGEVTGVAQEQVVKQMKPFTDKMVDIEREFNNSGYEINTDYDNEIQVLDKNGEQVEPDELPDNLKKLAADYEKATSKLGEFDASAREKALNQSRGIIDTEAEVVKTKQAELPQQKGVGEAKTGIESKSQDTQNEELNDMKDIVKDLVDEGKSLDDITKQVTSDLGDNSQATKDLISKAHSELTKKPAETKVSGISHEALTQTAERLGMDLPQRGKGTTPEQQQKLGQDFIEAGVDPEEIANDFVKSGKKKVSGDELAVAQAHYANLQKVAQDAMDKYGRDSKQCEDAVAEMQIWQDEILKPMGTIFHEIGQGLQAGTDIDTGSYIAMEGAVKEKTGQDLTSEQQKKVTEISDKSKKAEKDLQDTKNKLTEHIDNAIDEENKKEDLNTKIKKIVTKVKKSALPSFLKNIKEGKFKSKPQDTGDQEQSDALANAVVKMENLLKKGVEPSQAVKQAVEELVKLNGEESRAEIEDGFREYYDNKGWEEEEETPEQKKAKSNIKRLEKELEDLKQGKEKGKPVKREITDKENQLKKQIQDEKDFLTYNKLVTSLQGKKDNNFTMEQIKGIWEYAKKEYLDKGVEDFDDMFNGVATDLGLTPDQVRRAISQPKGAKAITEEMYRNKRIRDNAVQYAKDYVASVDNPNALKFMKALPAFFFSLRTFGHGTVGFITHAGMDIFNPNTWKMYFPHFLKQFQYAYGSTAKYEAAMADLVRDKDFIKWKNAGLAIDPKTSYTEYEGLKKMFGKLGMAGDRGFNALKVYRLAKAKAEYNKLSNTEKADPKMAQYIAEYINRSTGTTDVQVPGFINTTLFAPKLIASQFERITTQPIKALATLSKGSKASPAERAAAKIVVKNCASVIATYAGALAANGAMLALAGSNQTINYTDPSKKDWLRFKIGDKQLDISSGIIPAINFIGSILAYSVTSKSKKKDIQDAGTSFLLGKVSPLASTIKDVLYQEDFHGDIMPFSNKQPTPGHHKLTWKEYLLKSQAPIPVAEAMNDFYKSTEEKGMKPAQREDILNAIFMGTVSGFTGAKLKEITPGVEEKPVFTEKEMQTPVFKDLTKTGLEIPELGTRLSYTVKPDEAHPKGIMTTEEFKKFSDLVIKYSHDYTNENLSDSYTLSNIKRLKELVNKESEDPKVQAEITELKKQIKSTLQSAHQNAIDMAREELKLYTK